MKLQTTTNNKLQTTTNNKVARKWRNLPHLLQHVGICGKVRHRDHASAQTEANRLASIFTINQKFIAYRCSDCMWWHVTSNSYSPQRNLTNKRQRRQKYGGK